MRFVVCLAGVVCLTMSERTLARAARRPPDEGLVLWLDAADTGSVECDAAGRVIRWRDRSPAGNDALPGELSAPVRIADGLHGKPVLRFDGKSMLQTEKPLAEGKGGVTAFVVYQRTAEQASEHVWQRLLSVWDPATKRDIDPPSFIVGAPRTGKALAPAVAMGLFARVYRGRLTIGAAGFSGGNRLLGDIGELLVYDHAFLTYEQIQRVKQYLLAKWSILEDTSTDWTLVGPLPKTPARTSDHLPLSDQTNRGKWQPFEPMWDEFNGDSLDAAKWWDHNPGWYGRAPSRYITANARVADGALQIIMSRDESLPVEELYKNGTKYHTYAAGTAVSKTVTVYGYFEIRARCMNSAASSAWWFSGSAREREGGTWRTEIDVFEIGGKAPGFEHKYNMNLHVFETPQEKRHWSQGGTWVAPFNFVDDYHVFGLEWTPDHIRYYLNGALVRSVKNTHWHSPMKMLFDTETMPTWLGMPRDQDLPSTFSIDYVRAWKNPATTTNWQRRFTLPSDPRAPTKITNYVHTLSVRGQ